MKKHLLQILVLSILITSCNQKKLPTPEDAYNFYISCAKGNVNDATQFLTEYPEYADIPLYETTNDLKKYRKTKTVYNNAAYQKFFNYLCDEGKIQFTNEEIDNGEKRKLQNTYKRYPINVAARYGNLEIVKLLLSYNADINICEENGNTPLISATQNAYIDVIKELLENNAQINYKNDNDASALNMAVINNNIEIVQELLKYHADVEITSQGYTPLMYASNFGNLEISQLLISNNANINAQTKDGQTALQFAAINQQKDVVRFLINNGADINGKDNQGLTAMMEAVYADNYDIVNMLIKAGADVNASVSITGSNVLDIAVGTYEEKKTDKRIISLLVNNGANSKNVDISKYVTLPKKQVPQIIVPKSDLKYTLSGDGTYVIITKYTGTYTNIIFPSEIEDFPVKQIGNYESVFKNNKTFFEKVTISNSVTIIKDNAFEDSKIKHLVIPNTVEKIGSGALDNISYLEELEIPYNLDQNYFGILLSKSCNLNTITFPNLHGPDPQVHIYAMKESKVNRIEFPQGAVYVDVGGDIRNIHEITIPSTIVYFTGRVLLNPNTKFIIPSSVRSIQFSYYWYMVSSGEFSPYIISTCSLKERKEIQDFWRNLGYKGYFAEDEHFNF